MMFYLHIYDSLNFLISLSLTVNKKKMLCTKNEKMVAIPFLKVLQEKIIILQCCSIVVNLGILHSNDK